MKRYQVHIIKTIEAELLVEAESEEIARNYIYSRGHDFFHWRDTTPTKVVHIDEIEGNPEE